MEGYNKLAILHKDADIYYMNDRYFAEF